MVPAIPDETRFPIPKSILGEVLVIPCMVKGFRPFSAALFLYLLYLVFFLFYFIYLYIYIFFLIGSKKAALGLIIYKWLGWQLFLDTFVFLKHLLSSQVLCQTFLSLSGYLCRRTCTRVRAHDVGRVSELPLLSPAILQSHIPTPTLFAQDEAWGWMGRWVEGKRWCRQPLEINRHPLSCPPPYLPTFAHHP